MFGFCSIQISCSAFILSSISVFQLACFNISFIAEIKNHQVPQQGSKTFEFIFTLASSTKSSVMCFGVKTIQRPCLSHHVYLKNSQ